MSALQDSDEEFLHDIECKTEIETDIESNYDDDEGDPLKSQYVDDESQLHKRCLGNDGDKVDVNCNKCQAVFTSLKLFLKHLEKLKFHSIKEKPSDFNNSLSALPLPPEQQQNENYEIESDDVFTSLITFNVQDSILPDSRDDLQQIDTQHVEHIESNKKLKLPTSTITNEKIVTQKKHSTNSTTSPTKIIVKDSKNKYQCSVTSCIKTFKYESILKKHVQICGSSSSNNNSTKKKRVHLPGLHICPWSTCNKTFKYQPGLSLHISKHKKGKIPTIGVQQPKLKKRRVEKIKPRIKTAVLKITKKRRKHLPGLFVCPEISCGRTFTYRPGLSHHMKKHAEFKFKLSNANQKHGNKQKDDKKTETIKKGLKLKKGQKIVEEQTRQQEIHTSCSLCNQIFKSEEELSRHEKTHKTTTNDNNNQVQSSNTGSISAHQNRGIESKDKRRFTCSECNAKFINSGNLKNHLRLHSKETPFACSDCDRSFSDPSNLKKHVDGVHRGIRSFLCPQCGKSFTQSCSLNRHLRNIHQGVSYKKFLCPTCGKLLQTKHAFLQHCAIHTRPKELKCPDPNCKKVCKVSKGLKGHIRAHHPNLLQESSLNGDAKK